MRAIIFGINGQDGYYLKKILHQYQVEVIGVSRSINSQWIQGNIGDYSFVKELISTYQPNFIFHLAANSTTRHDVLFENHESISTGTINILEAVYKYSKHSKVFLSGSAVQFENKDLPIDENTAFAPLSPYAVARIHSVFAGRYYRNKGMSVYVGYFFNHDSPLRTERHINQQIVRAVQRIARGSNELIEIGDMEVQKEFNHAYDICEGIWRVVNQNNEFEFVIGSGIAYSIKEWIIACFLNININNWEKYIKKNNVFLPDYKILVSNPFKLKSLGWQPSFDLKSLAHEMMDSYVQNAS